MIWGREILVSLGHGEKQKYTSVYERDDIRRFPNHEKAQYWAQETRTRRKDASVEAFFTAFPFRDSGKRKALSAAMAALGFPEE